MLPSGKSSVKWSREEVSSNITQMPKQENRKKNVRNT